VRISHETINALTKVLTGDGFEKAVAPYRTGPELIEFFNDFGRLDRYGPGFPSRWHYTKSVLDEFNGTDTIKDIIEAALDPRSFLDSKFDVVNAVEYLNMYLKYDGYKISRIGKF